MTVSIEPAHPGEILCEDVIPALPMSKTAVSGREIGGRRGA